MKLRNKKTEEIVDLAKRGLLKSDNDNHIIVYPEGTLKYYAYNSLAELNEEWEDYKPAEPRIEDEKVQKAIRAFCEVTQEKKRILVIKQFGRGSAEFSVGGRYAIRLPLSYESMDALEDGRNYTLTELCGEEGE